MGDKLRGWFTPVRIALAGFAVVALLLLYPVSFRAPGDHEQTNCGNPLFFNPQNYNRSWVGERDYWQPFVNACTIRRTTRLAQTLGVLAVTGLLVTISLASSLPASRRRSERQPT
ncbi:hypothetical protein FXN61_45920 [Lentzea sp. PSKA42]|uniref:Uncharacterized protein n=1 Tax=Lentzea indica TaxID=2604800 RepID=A0ABX1FX87_9PSEU|nr:hypothetical protein [Lentzea indica]NKE63668.1 hypothetical protein [Lentzea indica]